MAKGQKSNTRKFAFKNRKTTKNQQLNLDEIMLRFLETKKLENRSPKTIKTYKQSLDHFAKWYTDSGLERIDTDCLRNYIEYMRFQKEKWDDHETLAGVIAQTGVSARTVNNIIRNLRVFFNWAEKERSLSINPTAGIKYLTEEKGGFEVFSDEDVRLLLSAPAIKTYTGFRDYVMMLTLIDTGIRIGELTNLRIENVDLKLRQITVPAEVAKNNTLRVLPIGRKTRDEIEKLIDYINVEQSDYLFLSQFGERFHSDSFAKLLKKYGKKVGVAGVRCSPHTFRHYFAVKFLRSGGESFSLMRILGHTDMAMTNRYVRYSLNEIQLIHEKASPVANLYQEHQIATPIRRKNFK
ncbi:tyrosine-type recombinase/integrase [Bacillus mesophilum]|uniref:Tyrosine-type recombinase/integrase n=1 Tax=Bacillus mesophilum TaxID=1071718 RepID=A0A7V7RLZ7_9BACI|nr:tyrosine-type recombinase/integrase [Bacillus mesophilum]KAB2332921.1 tyrosine-type recombinase/integrase [Bacillus mesophilum]